jgi:hypothetical protein
LIPSSEKAASPLPSKPQYAPISLYSQRPSRALTTNQPADWGTPSLSSASRTATHLLCVQLEYARYAGLTDDDRLSSPLVSRFHAAPLSEVRIGLPLATGWGIGWLAVTQTASVETPSRSVRLGRLGWPSLTWTSSQSKPCSAVAGWEEGSIDQGLAGRSGACSARGCAVSLTCVGVALSIGVVTPLAALAPSFAGAKEYRTGSHTATSVAVGDLNGDGKLDLAVAHTPSTASGTVSVLVNSGDGTFRDRRDHRTGKLPRSVAIGDLNDDGDPDLAIGNGLANTVSVLLNRGDGRFAARLDYRTGKHPASVAIGDLNGDGNQDLAIANAVGDTVSVLLNRGGGRFLAKRDYRTGAGPASVAIGDLNGDGNPDLAAANESAPGSVSVLLNRGDGSFHAKRDFPAGRWSSSVASAVAIGDLNGDGKPDLATTDSGYGTVSVFLNRGGGSFPARRDYARVYSGRGSANPKSLAIADLNADRKPDLVTANEGFDTVSVLVNRGGGTFRAGRDYRTGRGPYSVAIGNLNGDRKPDLVTADFGLGTVSVLVNATGRCGVPRVEGETLPVARQIIVQANCRVGKVRHGYSKAVKRGRVISEQPGPGTVLPIRGKVNLVLSRGRKR